MLSLCKGLFPTQDSWTPCESQLPKGRTRWDVPSPERELGSHPATYQFQTKEQLPLQPAIKDYTTVALLAADQSVSKQWCFSLDSTVFWKANTDLTGLSFQKHGSNWQSIWDVQLSSVEQSFWEHATRTAWIMQTVKSSLHLLNTEAEGGHFYCLSLLTELTGKKNPLSLKISSLLH